MARTNRPDEAYHVPTLNVWFAISALALFGTSVWMVFADYNRGWKTTQRDFRGLERERLAIAKEIAQKKVSAEQLQAGQKRVDDAEAALRARHDEVQKQQTVIDHLEQDEHYLAKQAYNFARASLGDLRYRTEEFAQHHPDDKAKAKKLYHEYECELFRVEGGAQPQGCPDNPEGKSLRARFLDAEDSLLAAHAAYDALVAQRKEAQGAVDAARAEVGKLDKAMATIEASFFNETFRDAPLLDFMVPSLKIQQVVVRDIRDDYNFATVQKEDRCMTCHLGIDKLEYAVDPTSGRFKDDAARTAIERPLLAALERFIDEKAPAAERKDLKESLEELRNKAALTTGKWLQENLEDEKLTAEFTTFAAEELEDLRVRTQTYKAHPRLDLYMTSASPHPMEAYGCSVCHEGRGHATEFDRAYHTPASKVQQAAWEDTYDWEAPHYWDYPQLPKDRLTASCSKCHDAEPKTEGATAFNRGKKLVMELGCFGCHRINGVTENLRKVGPSLHRLPSKVDREFAYAWIWDPKNFRPSTKMPRFFGQENNDAEPWLVRSQQEVRGIVAYLYANAESFALPSSVPAGDVAAGATLFREVGCLGCHSFEDEKLTANTYAPDLSGIGSKLSAPWIYAWVKNPRAYFPETHMPSLRLSDKEAADLTAFLVSSKKKVWAPSAAPARNEELQKELLRDAIETTMRRTEMDALFTRLSADEREVLLGQKSIAKYGCTGCHEVKGFEGAGPIGTELSTWGDKFITQLDFGLIPYHGAHAEVDYTHIAFATHKLENPRFWDRGKEDTKAYKELLKMPNFGLDEGEVHDLVTFLLSRKKQEVTESKRPALTAQYQSVQSGRWLVEQYNCHGCHYFDHDGGRFAQYWELNSEGQAMFKPAQRKGDFDFQTNIPGPVRGHAPPQLLDQGNKTQSDWLFAFLRDPSTRLRPQLKMRMPTFNFSDDEANRLNAMFAGFEGHLLGAETSFEPDAKLASLGQELFTRGQCTRCHMFTDVDPATAPANVVAPNLKLVGGRLQHTWTPRWLADPQSIMPGANMPNYFDLKAGVTTLDVEGTLLDQDGDQKLSEAELRRGMQAITHYLVQSGRTYKGAPAVGRGPQTASR